MWREQGACRRETVALQQRFFSDDLDDQHSAKQVCAVCPVVLDCLTFALATNQASFIWGGLTLKERRRMARRMKVPV